MVVDGRVAVVKRDMRPKHDRATLVWEDTGEEQKRVDASTIQKHEGTGKGASARLGASGTRRSKYGLPSLLEQIEKRKVEEQERKYRESAPGWSTRALQEAREARALKEEQEAADAERAAAEVAQLKIEREETPIPLQVAQRVLSKLIIQIAILSFLPVFGLRRVQTPPR